MELSNPNELIMLGKIVQIANGRRRRGMCALRRSTGAAVASANLLIGSRKSINVAVRVTMQFGMQSFKPKIDKAQIICTLIQGKHIHTYVYRKAWLNSVWHRRHTLLCKCRTRLKSIEIESAMYTQVYTTCIMVDRRGVFFLGGIFGLGIGLL